MHAAWSIRVMRFLWYASLVVGLPVFVTGLWWLLNTVFFGISTFWYLAISQLVVAVLVVTLILARVTERVPSAREAELVHLLGAQEKFLSLYEHSPVPYITLDRSGNIAMHNLATVRLFHATTDSLIGESFASFLRHEDPEVVRSVRHAIEAGRVVEETEVQIELSDGTVRWVLLSVFVYKKADQRLVALVDITRQKEIDIAKSEFVALATHQLRTPVSAIRWNVELLQKSAATLLDEKQSKYLTKIDTNIQRMVALINDFLNVSKLEMGTFATHEESIDVAAFCDEVLEEFAERVAQKQITLTSSYTPQPLQFCADPRLLHIIVSNLVSNAVKYVPANGTVRLTYEQQQNQLIFTVADTGIGIPLAAQQDLFTKFFRASNAQQHHTEGTGLGLYVVKQSVEKLSGSITYESTPDVGTTFTVTLPYRA